MEDRGWRMGGCMDGYVDGSMDDEGWMDGRIDGWTDEWVGGWRDRWMGGLMGRRKERQSQID